MTTPLVSVLIAAYNVENYVAQAVSSALDQTYKNTEVIVVNDGSTDATAEALAPFRDRIVYVEQPNRGAAAARNRALELATGEFVAILDADDAWKPERLAYLVDHVMGRAECNWVFDGIYRARRWRWRVRLSLGHQTVAILLRNFVHPHALVRKSLVVRHGGWDERLVVGNDWDLWLRLILAGERVEHVPVQATFYRVRAGSLSSDVSRARRCVRLILEKALTESEAAEDPKLRSIAHIRLAIHDYRDGDDDAARKRLRDVVGDRDAPGVLRAAAFILRCAPILANARDVLVNRRRRRIRARYGQGTRR